MPEQLMREYVAGDRSAFNELYNQYNQKMRKWVRRYVRKHEVNDATQEAWIYFTKYAQSYQPGKPFVAWLASVARSAAQRLAQYRVEYAALPMDPAVEDDEPQIGITLDVYFIICGLPADQQAVIWRVYYDGKSIRQVAGELGIGVAIVRRLKREALANLKNSLTFV